MANTQRVGRVNDALQQALADIIQRELSDPRFGFLTVTDVIASPDLSSAKVYVSSLTTLQNQQTPEDYQQQQLALLTKSTGFIRHLLGQRVKLRVIPSLHFIYDDSAAKANHISRVIDKAIDGPAVDDGLLSE